MLKTIPYKRNLLRIFSDENKFIRKNDNDDAFLMEAIDKKEEVEKYDETEVQIPERNPDFDLYYD